MENIVKNHIVQQQAQPAQKQFVVPMQNAKFVVNTANVNHTNAMNVNHAVGKSNHTVNHNINHTVNPRNPALVKANTSAMPGAANEDGPLISKARIRELAEEEDPNLQLQEEVVEMLQKLGEMIGDKVVNGAIKLAKRRHVPVAEVKDVQIYVARNCDFWNTGFGIELLRPRKRTSSTQLYKQRLALKRRDLKK